ncbi:MAG: hypothetical protein EOO13_09940 [Chitinophagaceae bacterium]|nr:MAG: hypothetical protein EOO13_09940 [Chitinophagaceae bacterium]
MKGILLALAVICSGTVIAQPRLITQATINTTTTVIAPDEEDVSAIQNQGGGGGMNFRNFGDGETKSVTYLKNDLVKTVMKSDMGRSTIIRDNNKKLTTTLIEMMGNKTGFYSTDEEAAGMRKRMDSMMQATRNNAADTTKRRTARTTETVPPEIIYTQETKKIAGYVCKQAYIVHTRFLGNKDSAVVWYTPEFKLQNVSNTGGLSGFANLMGNMSANPYEKVDGFVMGYETKMPRGRNMIVEVTKVELAKEIADKEFDIPKDFDVKPMKEMQNMMQGGGGQGRIMIRN